MPYGAYLFTGLCGGQGRSGDPPSALIRTLLDRARFPFPLRIASFGPNDGCSCVLACAARRRLHRFMPAGTAGYIRHLQLHGLRTSRYRHGALARIGFHGLGRMLACRSSFYKARCYGGSVRFQYTVSRTGSD